MLWAAAALMSNPGGEELWFAVEEFAVMAAAALAPVVWAEGLAEPVGQESKPEDPR